MNKRLVTENQCITLTGEMANRAASQNSAATKTLHHISRFNVDQPAASTSNCSQFAMDDVDGTL
jgi:hypothetical protein